MTPQSRKTILLFSKGLAMGAADSVPGVSGGTIAVIAGIYDELIYSLRSFNLQALRLLVSGDLRGAWTHINGTFLLVLGAGILLSLRLSAGLVLYLLDVHFAPLMGFFVGLVLASTVYLRARFGAMGGSHWVALVLGMALTLAVGSLTPQAPLNFGLAYVFFSGMVAICAMILPGISGAFVLLLLGVYDYVLAALTQWAWDVIVVFAAGCAIGLLSFSRVLGWALSHYRDVCYAFLTGMLLASVYVLWPWQTVQSFFEDAEGVVHPLGTVKLSPFAYEAATGLDPRWLSVSLALIAGAGIIVAFEKLFGRRAEQTVTHVDPV